jgi:hypothetical protein
MPDLKAFQESPFRAFVRSPFGARNASLGPCAYIVSAILDWEGNADLDLYVYNGGPFACSWSHPNVGNFHLNHDGPPAPEEITGEFRVWGLFQPYYAQRTNSLPEQTPTAAFVKITNIGDQAIYVDGETITPGQFTLRSMIHAGYNQGDRSSSPPNNPPWSLIIHCTPDPPVPDGICCLTLMPRDIFTQPCQPSVAVSQWYVRFFWWPDYQVWATGTRVGSDEGRPVYEVSSIDTPYGIWVDNNREVHLNFLNQDELVFQLDAGGYAFDVTLPGCPPGQILIWGLVVPYGGFEDPQPTSPSPGGDCFLGCCNTKFSLAVTAYITIPNKSPDPDFFYFRFVNLSHAGGYNFFGSRNILDGPTVDVLLGCCGTGATTGLMGCSVNGSGFSITRGSQYDQCPPCDYPPDYDATFLVPFAGDSEAETQGPSSLLALCSDPTIGFTEEQLNSAIDDGAFFLVGFCCCKNNLGESITSEWGFLPEMLFANGINLQQAHNGSWETEPLPATTHPYISLNYPQTAFRNCSLKGGSLFAEYSSGASWVITHQWTLQPGWTATPIVYMEWTFRDGFGFLHRIEITG